MSKFTSIKPIAIALGVVVASGAGLAQAESPFGLSPLSSGYTVAGHGAGEVNCGEGKCGADKIFEAMDTNKDGKVSGEEHSAHADAKFKKADANGDGSVSKDEMEAMISKHHEGKAAGEGKCGAGK
jgi:uncharacterized low-complexity protein